VYLMYNSSEQMFWIRLWRSHRFAACMFCRVKGLSSRTCLFLCCYAFYIFPRQTSYDINRFIQIKHVFSGTMQYNILYFLLNSNYKFILCMFYNVIRNNVYREFVYSDLVIWFVLVFLLIILLLLIIIINYCN